MYTHIKYKMPPLAFAFHFVRKLTSFKPKSVCVCVPLYACHGVRWYGQPLQQTERWRAPITNHWDFENDRRWGRRKCSFIRSFPTSVFSARVFSDTPLCLCVCLCLLYENSSVACVWSHWQLHYGLCAQGDSTMQKERTDIGQARLNIGQTVRGSSGWLVEKVEEGSCCLL